MSKLGKAQRRVLERLAAGEKIVGRIDNNTDIHVANASLKTLSTLESLLLINGVVWGGAIEWEITPAGRATLETAGKEGRE